MGKSIPVTINLTVGLLLVSLNTWVLLGFSGLLARDGQWGWLLIPLAGLTTTYWSLIHEAVHGVLFPGRRWNDLAGRLLGVVFGSPFRILRFGHMMHHRLNRTALDQSEVYDPSVKPIWRAWPAYYLRLLIGLYAFELAASLLVFVPRRWLRRLLARAASHDRPDLPSVTSLAERQILAADSLREIRVDSALVVLLYGGALWSYGAQAGYLIGFLLVRGFLISFFDNAYHYESEAGNIKAGYNLRLPRWAAAIILNFNYHHVHHCHPALPWIALPGQFAREDSAFEGGYLGMALRQLRGPVAARQAP